MSSRQCKTDPNRFCCICGEFALAKEKRSITSHIKKMYKAYFDCYLGDQDKSWPPHVCCLTCVKTLSDWYAGKNVPMKFSVPMIWRDQKYHSNDCYFCQHDFTGCNKAKKKTPIVYPNLQSAMRPVEHSENLPALKSPDQEMQSSISADEHSSDEYVEHGDPESENKPILNNLLDRGVKIILCRKRTQDQLVLFTMRADLCFCNDITELFEQLEIPYDKTN